MRQSRHRKQIVPENRKEVTTEGGLNVIGRLDEISEAAEKFAERGIECSLFIDPDERQVEAAKKTGAPLVELHTGAYANSWGNLSAREFETKRLEKASKLASELGLKVNAGHGLNYENTGPLLDRCEFNELNIGHTIISRALLVGLKEAVSQMKSIIVKHSKSDGIRE